MLTPAALAIRQGLAYVVVAHGVLHKQAARTKCPAALLHTLLALHAVNDGVPYALPVSTAELQQAVQIRLPLLRGYLRELIGRGYVERERVFRHGPRLLRLTAAGQLVASACQRELKYAAGQLLERRGLMEEHAGRCGYLLLKKGGVGKASQPVNQ